MNLESTDGVEKRIHRLEINETCITTGDVS